MPNKPDTDLPTPLGERERYANQARFLEEVSHGLYTLLRTNKRNRKWLAARLDRSKPFVTKLLEGSHNFTLETLADVSLALGRGVHVVFGVQPEEMRLPVDEAGVTTMLQGTSGEPDIVGRIGPSAASVGVLHFQTTVGATLQQFSAQGNYVQTGTG